jgi:hypothetical protein
MSKNWRAATYAADHGTHLGGLEGGTALGAGLVAGYVIAFPWVGAAEHPRSTHRHAVFVGCREGGTQGVEGPITMPNLCVDEPSEPSESSEPSEPSDPPSETTEETTSSDVPLPTTTDPETTGVPDDFTNTSSGSGGLAATGVAVAVLVGIGAVLFADGAGLVRLVRRDRSDDDE